MGETSGEDVTQTLAELKVPGGKLVTCQLVVKGVASGVPELVSIGFYGDFFLHPEERIEEIEESLRSIPLEDLPEGTRTAFQADDLELVGVGPVDFMAVVTAALEKLRE